MIWRTGALGVLLVLAVHAEAGPAFRTLHFLRNGHYRLDTGPELDLLNLEIEIKRMARERDCPDVHLAPDHLARYDTVAGALAIFQKYGCNDLGFRGIENSH